MTPTGYTARIMEKDFDLTRWLIEDLPRNFGLLITLRDEPWGFTEKQIMKQLTKDFMDNYHLKELRKAERELIRCKKKTDEQWQRDMKKDNAKEICYRASCIKRNAEGKKTHDDIKQQLIELKVNANDFAKKVLAFGISQIDSTVDNDFKYVPDIHIYETVGEYKQSSLDNIKENITYHKTECKKSQKRTNERLEIYKQYVEFIKTTLKNRK